MIPEVIQQGIDASEYFILFTSDRTDFTSVRLFEESAYAKDKGKKFIVVTVGKEAPGPPPGWPLGEVVASIKEDTVEKAFEAMTEAGFAPGAADIKGKSSDATDHQTCS